LRKGLFWNIHTIIGNGCRLSIGLWRYYYLSIPAEISTISLKEPDEVISSFLPSIIVSEEHGKAVLNGCQIWLEGIIGLDGQFKKDDLVRITDEKGKFLAIAQAERTSRFITWHVLVPLMAFIQVIGRSWKKPLNSLQN